MNIFTTSRFAKILALVLILAASVSHAQHPKGLWYPGQTLPGLGGNGHLLFVDSLLGYYIGVDTGFVTKDGGQSWKWINFPSNARPSASYLFAPDHNTIISYQQYNTDSDGVKFPGIIKSIDMGTTWTLVDPNSIPAKVKAFTMWTANDGFRIWLNENVTPTRDSSAITHDGGITWSDPLLDATLKKYTAKLTPPTSLSLRSAWSDQLHGALSFSPSSGGSGTPEPILTTADGGKSWAETYPGFQGNTGISHSFVYLYPGSQTIWTVPSVPNTAEYIFYSTDFASTWKNTPQFARGDVGVGNNTKPGVIQLASISPTETWALLASDTDHPDLSRFIGYNNLTTGWERDTLFSLKGGGFFGYKLNSIQFTDKYHGWAILTETYFDQVNKVQVTKDSVFIFSFRGSPPVKSVKPISTNIALRCIPNPASSNISIEGFSSDEQIKDVKIINTLGNKFSRKVENHTSGIELDVSSLPNGCYMVSITTSLRKENVPVMVVH